MGPGSGSGMTISSMKKELEELKKKAKKEVQEIASLDALESFKNKYLGRKGELAQTMKKMKDLAADQRPVIGEVANSIKEELHEIYDQTLSLLGEKGGTQPTGDLDVTLPGKPVASGNMHILTRMLHDWEDVFRDLGFRVADGPELESEYYNFETLNIPASHPARDMWDTIYAEQPKKAKAKMDDDNKWLLRTHTSPVQVRAMEKYGAPLRIIIPGRVFRYEATDARHEHTFHQVEGLMIDRNVSLASLIGIMEEAVKKLVGDETLQLRVRPGYFPFTEPSIEFDLSCILCGQKGCAVCKKTGWLEFGGAGLVHPKVIAAGGLDPQEWQGFAFGMGPARLAMLKHDINDIRLFNSGDLRFLQQFR